jgi:hypothetical protein
MQEKYRVSTFRSNKGLSGPRTLASGSRRAQEEGKRSPAVLRIPRPVLIVVFFAASLASIWLVLNAFPWPAFLSAAVAVGALVRDPKRSKRSSWSSSNELAG